MIWWHFITYFQDTIFQTDSALEAAGVGTALKVAVNNTFSTESYTLIVTVASINTNVNVNIRTIYLSTIVYWVFIFKL